tara:strand:+ start:401 stop:574 length:174 start_codon:yes stop_codon:yes gene_type:complete
MCIICVEIQANRLTTKEAFRNYREMKHSIDEDHQKEILKKLYEKRQTEKNPQNQKNP